MIWALNNAGGLAPRRQFSVKPFQVLPPQFDGIWFIHIISPVMVKATYGHSSKSEWGNANPWKIRLALKHLLRFKTFHHASTLPVLEVAFQEKRKEEEEKSKRIGLGPKVWWDSECLFFLPIFTSIQTFWSAFHGCLSLLKGNLLWFRFLILIFYFTEGRPYIPI